MKTRKSRVVHSHRLPPLRTLPFTTSRSAPHTPSAYNPRRSISCISVPSYARPVSRAPLRHRVPPLPHALTRSPRPSHPCDDPASTEPRARLRGEFDHKCRRGRVSAPEPRKRLWADLNLCARRRGGPASAEPRKRLPLSVIIEAPPRPRARPLQLNAARSASRRNRTCIPCLSST